MRDGFGRSIEYLRVSVTDRCDMRCRYCGDSDGRAPAPADRILSFEEIVEVARSAVDLGIFKVRLTGGEPLVRRDVVELVRMLAQLPGVRDLAMTTNGSLLARFAGRLAAAGLHRVNVSLDTIDPDRYRATTGGGELAAVLAGIDAAKSAGLRPIKLNCVVERSAAEPDARLVADFAARHDFAVRFIKRMDLRAGRFGVVEKGGGGDCARCNRLRLTSDGTVRPCLFSDRGFNVRALGARRALEAAIANKPRAGGRCAEHAMQGIGG
jgi:cyclic pyranopterin phosphate synthase